MTRRDVKALALENVPQRPPTKNIWPTGGKFRHMKSVLEACHINSPPICAYFIFVAATADCTITVSPERLPFTVAFIPASLSRSASCPSSV